MFKTILVIFAAAQFNTADTSAALTLQPETSIEFVNTTAKKATADCERVRKALVSSGKTAFCGDAVQALDDTTSAE